MNRASRCSMNHEALSSPSSHPPDLQVIFVDLAHIQPSNAISYWVSESIGVEAQAGEVEIEKALVARKISDV